MATVNTNFVFIGKSQSVITWGRALTDAEQTTLRLKRGSMMAEGKFGSFPIAENGITTYPWINAEAAAEYIAVCNAMTPPPVSAVVEDIPEPIPPTPPSEPVTP